MKSDPPDAMFHSPTWIAPDIICQRMTKYDAIERLANETVASLNDGTFVRLTLSSPIASGDTPLKVLGRCVMLRGEPHLSLTLRHRDRDVTKNLPPHETNNWLREHLEKQFRSALLSTTRKDWQFISKEGGEAKLIPHTPSSKKVPSRKHDQPHEGFLDKSAKDWLQGLGVLDRDAKLRASMADKHRQINHYLELLSHLANECGWTGSSPEDNPIQLADMGCGKGYLTFGAWHLFNRVIKRRAHVIGVEVRTDLVAQSNKLARQIGADGLRFVAGTIDSTNVQALDAIIALHACNTATDDAIRRGIELKAKLIIVAPCCHKELRPQIGKPEPLGPVLRHGLMEERMAEWLTDGLRALFLEWAGYRTKVMEFVGSEHTPKNLMIAAIRERKPFTHTEARVRIEMLKRFFGVRHHTLDQLLEGSSGIVTENAET